MNRAIGPAVVLFLLLAACGAPGPTPTPLPPIAANDLLELTRAAMDEVTSLAFIIELTDLGGNLAPSNSRYEGHWVGPDSWQYDSVITTEKGTWEGTSYRIDGRGQGIIHSGPDGRPDVRAAAAISLANITNTLVLGEAVVEQVVLDDGQQAYLVTSDRTREFPSDDGTWVATARFFETMLIDPNTHRLLQRRNLYETTCAGAVEGLCGTNSDMTTTYADYNMPFVIEFPEPDQGDSLSPPTATPTAPDPTATLAPFSVGLTRNQAIATAFAYAIDAGVPKEPENYAAARMTLSAFGSLINEGISFRGDNPVWVISMQVPGERTLHGCVPPPPGASVVTLLCINLHGLTVAIDAATGQLVTVHARRPGEGTLQTRT